MRSKEAAKMMKYDSVWKIYIPHVLLDSKKGFLHGYVVPSRCFICIAELSENNICELPQSPSGQQKPAKCVGFWHGKQALSKNTSPKENIDLLPKVWVDISPSRSMAPLCSLQISEDNTGLNFIAKNATCIIYNATDLFSSYLLKNTGSSLSVKNELCKSNGGSSNLDILVYFLHLHFKCDSVLERQAVCDHILVKLDSKHNFLSKFTFYITNFMCCIYFALGKVLNNRLVNGYYFKEAVNHVAFFHQIDLRYLQVQQVWKMTRYEHFQEIRKQNIHTRLLLDMVLGIMWMILLMKTGAADIMAYYIITWADSVVVWLNSLLDWLMGVPAGLKLNSQLDQFLGRFFHYHIYLWTGYLTLLKPVLAPLLWYSSIVGVLGISTQLCLLQDIFSTLTVHIYCFYVYAARLYYFQLYGLSSLWRLFRGKKWNVLRRRVDSASYDVDQLFVGTLVFTILLFLLPTTALYYVVFLGLRLIVLSLTGLVSKIVSLINTLPLHGLLLRFFRSSKITGDIMLTVLPDQPSNETLCVSMQTIQVPYRHILDLLREENKLLYKHPSYTWGSLIRRVFVGELIYPWVEPALGSSETPQ